jgi:hypothetical protein
MDKERNVDVYNHKEDSLNLSHLTVDDNLQFYVNYNAEKVQLTKATEFTLLWTQFKPFNGQFHHHPRQGLIRDNDRLSLHYPLPVTPQGSMPFLTKHISSCFMNKSRITRSSKP